MHPKEQKDNHQAQADPKPPPACGQGQRRPRKLFRRNDVDDRWHDIQKAHCPKHKLAEVIWGAEEILIPLKGLAGVVNTNSGIHRPNHSQRDTEDHFSVHLFDYRIFGLDPLQLRILQHQRVDRHEQGRTGHGDGSDLRAQHQAERR